MSTEIERDLLDHQEEHAENYAKVETGMRTISQLEAIKDQIQTNQQVSRGVMMTYMDVAGDDAVPVSLESFSSLPSRNNIALSIESIEASIESSKLMVGLAIAAIAVGVIVLVRKLLIYIRNRKNDVGRSTKKLKDTEKEWTDTIKDAEKLASKKNDDTAKRACQAAANEIEAELVKPYQERNKQMKMVSDKYTRLVEHIFVENVGDVLSRINNVHNNFGAFTKHLKDLNKKLGELIGIYQRTHGNVDLNADVLTGGIIDEMVKMSEDFKSRDIEALANATAEMNTLLKQPAELTVTKFRKFEDNIIRSSTLYFIDRLESFGVVGTDKNTTKIDDATGNECMDLIEKMSHMKETDTGESEEFFARLTPVLDAMRGAVGQYQSLLTLFSRVAEEYLIFIAAVGNVFNIRMALYKRFLAEIRAKGKDPADQKVHNYKDVQDAVDNET